MLFRSEYVITAEKTGHQTVFEKITIEGAGSEEKTVTRTLTMQPGKDESGANARQEYKLLISVIDARTRKPLEASVAVLNTTGEQAGNAVLRDGVYELTLSAKKGEEFRIAVENPGYVYQNQPVTMDLPVIRRTVALSTVAVGSTGIMRYLFFEIGRAHV